MALLRKKGQGFERYSLKELWEVLGAKLRCRDVRSLPTSGHAVSCAGTSLRCLSVDEASIGGALHMYEARQQTVVRL